MREKRMDVARTLFQQAMAKGPHLYEPHFNYALLQSQVLFQQKDTIIKLKFKGG